MFLAACNPAGGFTGLWIVNQSDAVVTDDTTGSENFVEGMFPVSTTTGVTDWIIQDDRTTNDDLFAVYLTGGPGKEAFMFVGADVVPGIKEGSTWLFSWSNFDNRDIRYTHPAGYTYTEKGETSTDTIIRIDFNGDRATGTLSGVSTNDTTWTETDLWDTFATTQGSSQMPVNSYLEVDPAAVGGTGGPPRNRPTDADCLSEPCTLTVSASTTVDYVITARMTSEDDPEAFSAFSGATDP